MKWITHQTGAALGAVALNLSAPAIALALAGAVWPDLLDQRISRFAGKSRQRVFNRIHRGSSHWFGWYLLLLLGIGALVLPPLAQECFLGFALGALSHVALDMLTPQGIPLLPFSRKGKLTAPICITGSWSEYAFLILMILVGICYIFHHYSLASWLKF